MSKVSKRGGLAALLLAALLALFIADYQQGWLPLPSSPGAVREAIRRVQRLRAPGEEKDAFEFIQRRTRRYSVDFFDAAGARLQMSSADWWKAVHRIRIGWDSTIEGSGCDHVLLDVANLSILLGE